MVSRGGQYIMGDRAAKQGGRHLATRQVVEARRVALEAVPGFQGESL